MFKLFRRKALPAASLHVNSSAEPEQLRVNLSATVNNAQIRRGVMHNGRPHTVIPSYTLPDDVIMNGLLYPHAEIEKSYKGLEGKLAPLGHPTLDGTYVPANTAEAINAHHIGAFNRNVERRGERVFLEKWLDEEYAANTEGGRKLLEALDKGEPIHTSTGIFLQADLTANGKSANGKSYRGTARNMVMDHDAILIGEIGAATPDDGVGLMVNNLRVEDAQPLTTNAVLSENSYGKINRLLGDAATAKWGQGDKFAWVEDFDSTTAIVHRAEGASAVAYSIADGVVTFADSGKPVVQKTDWIDKNPVVNRILQSLGIRLNSAPDTTPTAEGENDMDRKELDEALAANAKTQGEALEKLFAPIADRLAKLETNQKVLSDSLTANSRAQEAEKRAVVAAKHGDIVANALSGEALDQMHASLVGAAPVVPGFQGNHQNDGAYQKTQLPE